MLRYIGHDAVAVLDGGWAKWTRGGAAGPQRHANAARRRLYAARPRPACGVDVDDVERTSAIRSALLVDARSPERFEGQPDPLDNVAGHIPGARNRFYKDNLGEDGTMRPADELRDGFRARARRHDAPTRSVMYCGSGVTACHNLLAMEHAGLRARSSSRDRGRSGRAIPSGPLNELKGPVDALTSDVAVRASS